MTPELVKRIISEARTVGQAAAEKQLQVLKSAGPRFAMVENAKGDFLSDSTKPEVVVGTMLDNCGGAYLSISARTPFYRVAKKVCEDSSLSFSCHKSVYSGGILSIYNITNRQEMSVMEEAYKAIADYLKTHNIESRVVTYID
jgi:hypothetical protein